MAFGHFEAVSGRLKVYQYAKDAAQRRVWSIGKEKDDKLTESIALLKDQVKKPQVDE